MSQVIFVYAIIILALAYIVYSVAKKITSKKTSSCNGCNGCTTKK